MSAWVSVYIDDDPSHRLLVAHCLKCHAMVVAGKERKLVEAAALHHRCKTKSPSSRPKGNGGGLVTHRA